MRQFRSESLVSTPEQIQLKLALLNCEREQLRENAGTTELLERNRLAIGRCQYELSHALIQRYLAWPLKQAA